MAKIKIKEVPFQTPKGEIRDGIEKIVFCPKNVTNVNVRKSCSKCPMKIKLSYKDKYVDCKLMKVDEIDGK